MKFPFALIHYIWSEGRPLGAFLDFVVRLIGVHNLKRSELVDGFVQYIDAELGLQRVRDTPGQNLAHVLVHDGRKIQKAPPHG